MAAEQKTMEAIFVGKVPTPGLTSESQSMWLWPGLEVIACTRAPTHGLRHNVRYRVEAVSAASVRVAGVGAGPRCRRRESPPRRAAVLARRQASSSVMCWPCGKDLPKTEEEACVGSGTRQGQGVLPSHSPRAPFALGLGRVAVVQRLQ